MNTFKHNRDNTLIIEHLQHMKTINEHKTFLSRIDLILSGRDPYPWGQGIGISRGTINRIRHDQIPNADTLAIISKAENVSLSWLITGKGAPFIVFNSKTDNESMEVLNLYIIDEPGQWNVYILGATGEGIVMEQPGSYVHNDKKYSYRIVEIITGSGILTHKRILQALNSGEIKSAFHNPVSPELISSLRKGYIGTYALFGDKGVLLHNNERITLSTVNAWAEYTTSNNIGELSEDENFLIELYRQLTPKEKEDALRRIKEQTENLIIRIAIMIKKEAEKREIDLDRDQQMDLVGKAYEAIKENSNDPEKTVANIIDISDYF